MGGINFNDKFNNKVWVEIRCKNEELFKSLMTENQIKAQLSHEFYHNDHKYKTIKITKQTDSLYIANTIIIE